MLMTIPHAAILGPQKSNDGILRAQQSHAAAVTNTSVPFYVGLRRELKPPPQEEARLPGTDEPTRVSCQLISASTDFFLFLVGGALPPPTGRKYGSVKERSVRLFVRFHFYDFLPSSYKLLDLAFSVLVIITFNIVKMNSQIYQ